MGEMKNTLFRILNLLKKHIKTSAIISIIWWGLTNMFWELLKSLITDNKFISWVGNNPIGSSFILFFGSLIILIVCDYLTHLNYKADVCINRDSELYLGNPVVYLKIDNQEDKDIRDCHATMRRLDYKQILSESNKEQYQKDYIWHDWLIVSNLKKYFLSWSAFNPKEEKFIPAKNQQRIDIARIENDKLVFVFENENSKKWTKLGEYYLEVVFGGYIEGKQIKPEEFHGLLRYVIKDNKHQIYLFEKDFDEINK